MSLSSICCCSSKYAARHDSAVTRHRCAWLCNLARRSSASDAVLQVFVVTRAVNFNGVRLAAVSRLVTALDVGVGCLVAVAPTHPPAASNTHARTRCGQTELRSRAV